MRSVIYGAGGAVHQIIELMGTIGVDLGMVESLNETEDPDAATAEEGISTRITPFSAAFCKEKVLVAKPVHLLIHDNTDIDYRILV